ncbi:hypothetical protein ABH926_006443 [Catenulispora sp. GP43]|uniref:hypothetical protein n=1 Tax=Catenulispora sp. GP43 TaxID=3156263 RepID=UPI0035135DDD
MRGHLMGRMTSSRSRAARLGAVLATLLASAGCSRQSADSPPAPPAALEPAPGAALPTVKLSASAFTAVRVRTEQVRAASGGMAIPMTAVIYSPDGAAWTYAAVGPRSYLRHAIVIAHVTGTEAFLSSGPAVGTPVVTIGAPELLGAEYGVGEE